MRRWVPSILWLLTLALSLSACGRQLALVSPTPTQNLTPTEILDLTPSATATITITPTRTPTLTPTSTRTTLPTLTFTPTSTPTRTPTPTITLTPTQTETPVPAQPALLFPEQDRLGRTIDWGYFRLTEIGENLAGEVDQLSAFLSFQLVDRGIHRKTTQVAGKDLTLYYLAAQHEFDGIITPVNLILGGEWGRDVPLTALRTSGSHFVKARVLQTGGNFDPLRSHTAALEAYREPHPEYQGIFLVDLEQTLASLPQQLIVLADHPILVEKSRYSDLIYYFTNTPYMAARYINLVTLDENQAKVTGPSPQALEVASFLLGKTGTVPEGPLDLSSAILILIPGFES